MLDTSKLTTQEARLLLEALRSLNTQRREDKSAADSMINRLKRHQTAQVPRYYEK